MRHKKHHRILGRLANHRKSLLRGLTSSLLEHGSLVTTRPKAKELQKYIEPLITKGKQELTLHVRRQLLQVMPAQDVPRLVAVSKEQQDRPGGYTRITKLVTRRHDNAAMVRVDLVDSPKS